MKILIVEDNEKNLKLFDVILRQLGHAILAAANGEEGVRLALAEAPDLILMDIQMPILDGISALQRIREDPRGREIPAIALTAYAMKGDRERLIAAGFRDYIAKPIERKTFTEAVERALKECYGNR